MDEKIDSVSRRRFLGLGGWLALAIWGNRMSGLGNEKKKTAPIALQLYSVRKACAENFIKTIETVAHIGYEGVEFAGYYGFSAQEIRKVLDANGLRVAGTHTSLESLLDDRLEETVAFNQTLGNPYLIVPWLPEPYRESKEAWLRTADLFNTLAEKLAAYGMRVGYHNHAMEFDSLAGETPWDLFAQHTRPEVILQFDTGNAGERHVDPVAFLKRYPGRTVTIHIKEYADPGQKPLIGEGVIPFQEIVSICRATGGTEWFIIEDEKEPYPPLMTAEKNLHNFKAILSG